VPAIGFTDEEHDKAHRDASLEAHDDADEGI
jgi:hypothetical protein